MANLNTTTLTADQLSQHRQQFHVASVATIATGDVLYIDREAMIVAQPPVALTVTVSRGALGTVASTHAAGAIVYTGLPSKFHTTDPDGPPIAFADSPWINVVNGNIWIAQGDQVGPGARGRYWSLGAASRTIGALGTQTPPVAAS